MKTLFKAGVLVAAATFVAPVIADNKNVINGSGGPVVDGQGDCVVALGGDFDCSPAAPAAETVTLNGDALFATDKYVLSAQGQAVVDRLAASAAGAVAVEVVGHTDSVGKAGYNQTLSEKRAATVANALAARGVAPNVISMRGMGESQPVADNATSAGRQANRRVDVTIVKQ